TRSTNMTVQLGRAWTSDRASATDDCATAPITILSTVTNTAGHCGTTFDATRTWQATDACSNSAQCSQTVTVVDTTAPVIICSNSSNKTLQVDRARPFDAPKTTDNNGAATIT